MHFLIADQHILIGANEGLYTLNLNEIHENTMELVSISCRRNHHLFLLYYTSFYIIL